MNTRAKPGPKFLRDQHGLTAQEQRVLVLLLAGLGTKGTARRMAIGERMVKNYRKRLAQISGASKPCQLGYWAATRGYRPASIDHARADQVSAEAEAAGL